MTTREGGPWTFSPAFLAGAAVVNVVALAALGTLEESVFARKRFGELHQLPSLVHAASVHLLAIAAAETLALVVLYLLVARNAQVVRMTVPRVAAALALAWMLALALRVPTDGDAWAYVGYGIVPTMAQAYETPAQPFSGSFHAINDEWGTPLLPAIYGPVWIAYLRLLVGHAPSLAAGVLTLKVAAIAFFFALLALFRKLRAPTAFIAVVALNPAFIDEFVAGVHNDLPAVVLSLLALLTLRSQRVVAAIALLGAAALIKITFLAVSLTVIAGHGTLRRRLAWFSGVACVTAAGMLVGGAPLMHAMALVGGGWLQTRAIVLATHGVVAAVAAFAIVAAFVFDRWFPGAVWSFAAMNAMFYSWYQAWGIPFAVRTSTSWTAAAFFIAWPAVQQMIHSPVGKINELLVMVLMLAAFGGSIVAARMAPRTSVAGAVPATA
jgi:hypothetical protein